MSRSYTFTITPEQATDMAQEVHNDIDQNGEISQERILDCLVEELGVRLNEWLEEVIDWGKIEEDDLDARETYYEILEAEKGEY